MMCNVHHHQDPMGKSPSSKGLVHHSHLEHNRTPLIRRNPCWTGVELYCATDTASSVLYHPVSIHWTLDMRQQQFPPQDSNYSCNRKEFCMSISNEYWTGWCWILSGRGNRKFSSCVSPKVNESREHCPSTTYWWS